jgi:23S rRNA (cytosine1962-C5)-methyltransferase
MSSETRVAMPRLRLRLTAAAEARIRSGHPWVFAKSIREQNREGKSGELAVVYDRQNRFLAIGLFDPDSPLRVRILHLGKPQQIDRDWWRKRLQAALARREGLFDAQTTGYRMIHGESDGWPGLVLDRYERALVLKVYTSAWLPRLIEIVSLIAGELAHERLVLRLSRNIQERAREQFQLVDGQLLQGPELTEPVIFHETRLRFEADIQRGQKTGFFLDQRENRRLIEPLTRGRAVLNAFSFSGGFSVYAARGGARSVTDVDISKHALAGAKRNLALNRDDPMVSRCVHETVQADAFEWLATNQSSKFDLIILDPPSLAKRESQRAGAIQAYGRLALQAIARLARGGILVSASCSAHVSAAEFFETIRQVARSAERKFVELRTTGHPPDHPVSFKEGEYLKCIYLNF